MKKQKTSYNDAAEIYTNVTGAVPTLIEITDLWHKYANEWKHYDGFADYLIYKLD